MISNPHDIKTALSRYQLELSEAQINDYLSSIVNAQQYFPVFEQHALIIKLIDDWCHRQKEKIFVLTSKACDIRGGPCVTTFGILSVDWPGFSDTCIGIIHEMGWNIYYVKGFSMQYMKEDLGIMLIGVRTDKNADHKRITEQSKIIIDKIHNAAVGTRAKTFLLSEEIKKLEIYSHVIADIETIYSEDDLDKIIGLNGEAVKYFAARSRDYIENRFTRDIAAQILLNYSIMNHPSSTGSSLKLTIQNFNTKTEGTFTGITVGGPAQLLNLEDCLKTIELVVPNFLLKHNREFTTEEGISIYRIEIVDSSGNPLTDLEQKRLQKAFDMMVINKQRDKAQWIESIGGFEQYARAIIPLLVREAQSTNKPQVYLSPGHTTELFIDFKIIIVVPSREELRKKALSQIVPHLEAENGITIQRVKPPLCFGNTHVLIVDMRASLTEFENTEAVYNTIKMSVSKALGEFRDFDEGMRSMDAGRLKQVRNRLKSINKNLIRELYYSIEDFYRVSASVHDIIAHIQMALSMLKSIDENNEALIIHSRRLGTASRNGDQTQTSSLLGISFPHQHALLQKILEILEPYEVTLSRIERTGRDILLCRITKENRSLPEPEKKKLIRAIKGINS